VIESLAVARHPKEWLRHKERRWLRRIIRDSGGSSSAQIQRKLRTEEEFRQSN
jgi:hypothetical protein